MRRWLPLPLLAGFVVAARAETTEPRDGGAAPAVPCVTGGPAVDTGVDWAKYIADMEWPTSGEPKGGLRLGAQPSTSNDPVGTVTIGRPTVGRGSISAPLVTRWLNPHRNQLRYCYEQLLKRSPRLRGRVVVELESSGDRLAVKIRRSTVQSAELEACISTRIPRFPRPSAHLRATLSFDFAPR